MLRSKEAKGLGVPWELLRIHHGHGYAYLRKHGLNKGPSAFWVGRRKPFGLGRKAAI
ncbi:MAG: hypothetical protein LBE27_07965 [Deltaproteobacteria bacterium]|nr:hypothetical protein [Deltaproteobacteria bacterium]